MFKTDWVAKRVDPDQTPRSAASDLGIHCLLWTAPIFNIDIGTPYNSLSFLPKI